MNVFFSVCDYSSELYAKILVENILQKVDKIFVIGGSILKKLSDDYNNIFFWLDSVKYSSVGFFENLGYLPFMYLDFLKLRRFITNESIDLAILFDSPALNLRLIPLLKKKGAKIVYIIPPKSWSLVRTKVHEFVEQNCDLIVVPFKFNLEVYKSRNVIFLGHPIIEILPKIVKNDFNRKILGIFPGSRNFEVKYISKTIFDILELIKDRFEKFIVSSTSLTYNYLHYLSKTRNFELENSYENVINKIGISLAASGTVVLKNSLYCIPTICYYKVFKISEFIFKKIMKIRINKIALTNILWSYEFKMGDECIIPELIQDNYNPKNLINTIDQFLDQYDLHLAKMKEFSKIFFEFYPPNPLKNLSELIIKANYNG